MELKDEFAPRHARLLSHEERFHGAVSRVWVDNLELATTGARMNREWMERHDGVAVMAVRGGTAGPEMLLIRQYRHPVHALLWEIPAGMLDVEGEAPEAAAVRELREEADLVASHLTFLCTFFSSPGAGNERLTCYLAEHPTQAEEPFPRVDEEAEIERRWVPVSEVLEGVLEGRLSSPTLVTAVLAYTARSSRRRRPGHSVE